MKTRERVFIEDEEVIEKINQEPDYPMDYNRISKPR
jgi:hypothetical protein